MKQTEFLKPHWRHALSHGGELRKERAGRKERPLSGKHSLHLVFKTNLKAIPKGLRHPNTFQIVNEVIKQYSRRFFVKVESISIQKDHIHLLIRCYKRSLFKSFFKVVAGQIAQRVTGTSHETYEGPRVWKYRPFSRVVKGRKAEVIVRNYIQLNEKEANHNIPYQKNRTRGFSEEDLQDLWTS